LSPVGGLLALVGRLAPGRIRVATHACTGCASCVKACPVDAISMVRTEGETCAKAVVNQAECIVCKECEARCPEGGLSYGGPCPRQVSRPEA
jgi:formate hydrogenlyase subunit 6/NADH:ubiquinone oxidoreductase subunit I